MELKTLLAEVIASPSYQEFIASHSDAFFSMGLFILDYKLSNHQFQLDFFIPSLKRLASFEYPSFESKVHPEEITDLVEQNADIVVDIGDLKEKAMKILGDHQVSMVPSKIIAVLKADEWNLTCMDDMLSMVRIRLNAQTGEEVSFKKESLLQFAQVKGGDLGKLYDKRKDQE